MKPGARAKDPEETGAVYVIAPLRGDAAALTETVGGLGEAVKAIGSDELGAALERGANLLIITEEALVDTIAAALEEWALGQPDWSALPVLALISDPGRPPRTLRRLLESANKGGLFVTILSRPSDPGVFNSAVLGALASRRRQYRIRDQIAELSKARDHIELLARETRHRAKNNLAVLSGLLRGTLRRTGDVRKAVNSFEARLAAMGRSIDLLEGVDWSQISLAELVRVEAGSLASAEAERVSFEGPPLFLDADPAASLHLLLHELLTNAMKYGALSNETGRVEIRWEVGRSGEEDAVTLHWRETGGPLVTPPSAEGFGTLLLKATTDRLSGEMAADYAADGLSCVFKLPRRNLHADAS